MKQNKDRAFRKGSARIITKEDKKNFKKTNTVSEGRTKFTLKIRHINSMMTQQMTQLTK